MSLGRGDVERVWVRYRSPAYATPGQGSLLARTFGCAPVVFNDALRVGVDAHGPVTRSATRRVQRRVLTLAKTTAQRAWLGEVESAALVLAETQNARGGGVRLGLVPAAGCDRENPPRRRVSGTVGIPVVHGRKDVNSLAG
jgi:Helix-turn-helix domain